MNHFKQILALLSALILAPFVGGEGNNVSAQTHYVMIETNMGNMKVMLYDDCPKTINNFMKKVKEGYYNETLFGRVIQSFMIQGGAPDSRNAGPGWSLGYGDIDEEIEGEIRPNHIPKKGALAAPHREHIKNSDMSMFFIVQGYVQSKEYWRGWEKTLPANAAARKAAKKKVMTKAVTDSLAALKPGDFAPNEQRERYNQLVRQVNHDIDSIARATKTAKYRNEKGQMVTGETHFFTPDEIEAYSTVGGAYHLYMDYTIYGEVVEGLEVIDKIADLETNAADRPRKDVRMNIRIIK